MADDGPVRHPHGPPPQYLVDVPDGADAVTRTSLEIWNKAGRGVAAAAHLLRLAPSAALAVLATETVGMATTQDRMLIRFENHVFFDEWGRDHPEIYSQHFSFDAQKRWSGHKWRPTVGDAWRDVHGSQDSKWAVFTFARSLDERAALRSISMGSTQIMGTSADQLGYFDPFDMWAVLSSQEIGRYADTLALFDWLDGTMLDALRRRDYRAFARQYNGTGTQDLYADLIAKSAERLEALTVLSAPVTAAEPGVAAPGSQGSQAAPSAQEPGVAQVPLLADARRLAASGDIASAVSAVVAAVNADPSRLVPAEAFHFLCWQGTVHGEAAAVIRFCEVAVGRQPQDRTYRESMAVADAVTGQYERAAHQMEYVVERAAQEVPDQAYVNVRRGWLDDLKRGVNPFGEPVIGKLAQERSSHEP